MKSIAMAAAAVLFAAPASAALIDSFTLDMGPSGGGGSTGVTSSATLSLGTNYIVTVSGTFEIGCIGFAPCPTDAEYYVPSAGTNAGNPYSLTGFDAPGGLDVGVRIGSTGGVLTKPNWGPFNPARVYSVNFVGEGATLFVNYLDSGYSDNRGSLSVKIETQDVGGEIPLPASLPLLLGALAITGVAASRKRGRARSG